MIYLLKCAGLYKIGYSEHIDRRLQELQIGNPTPLEFVTSWPGSIIAEQNAHHKFKHRCVQGEWFDLNDEDLAALNEFLRPRMERPKRRGRQPPANYWPRPCHWCGEKPRMDGDGRVYCDCGWVWKAPEEWTASSKNAT